MQQDSETKLHVSSINNLQTEMNVGDKKFSDMEEGEIRNSLLGSDVDSND